jgi:hypothetical protein
MFGDPPYLQCGTIVSGYLPADVGRLPEALAEAERELRQDGKYRVASEVAIRDASKS